MPAPTKRTKYDRMTERRARVMRAFRPADQAAAFSALYERVLDGAKRP